MLKIACIWFACLMLCACAAKSSNEMEDMSRDVLKYKRGIDIQVKPLHEDGSH